MELLQDWSMVFTQTLLSMWYAIADFLPTLFIAVIIFAIGWLLAVLVEKLIEGLFKTFKVDSLLKTSGFEDVIERSGHKLNSGKFVGALVKWFVIVVFLVASFDVLKLDQVNDFLKGVVLTYLPNVIVAVLVIMVSAVIADAVHRIVVASARAAHMKSALFLGAVAKWSIWVFAVLAALFQLGFAQQLLQTLFLGIIVAISLALGLAFGLGGKDAASEIVEKTIRNISDKE